MPDEIKRHEWSTLSVKRHEPKRDAGQRQRKRFYDSKHWQDTRAAKLRRDPLCQCCAFDGAITQAAHVDHWLSLAQGGHPTEDSNLVSMCLSHHSVKTLAERNGTPLPNYKPSAERRFVVA